VAWCERDVSGYVEWLGTRSSLLVLPSGARRSSMSLHEPLVDQLSKGDPLEGWDALGRLPGDADSLRSEFLAKLLIAGRNGAALELVKRQRNALSMSRSFAHQWRSVDPMDCIPLLLELHPGKGRKTWMTRMSDHFLRGQGDSTAGLAWYEALPDELKREAKR